MNYAEAIDIRLRAAQNQYITPGALAEAHRVVAAARAEKREPDPILVHPSEPLPFLPVAVPVVVKEPTAIVKPVPEKTKCQLRCNHLGVCQAYRSCERPI